MSQRRNNAQWIVPLFLAGMIISGGIAVSRLQSGRDRDIEDAKAIARRGGIPLSKAEMYPKYTGDPEKNAFELLSKMAHEKTLSQLPDWPKLKDNQVDGAKAKAFLEQHKVYVDQVHRLTTLDTYSPAYKGEGFEIYFPQLTHVKASSRVLALEARIMVADGDLQGAAGKLASIIKIGNLAKDDYFLIPYLIRVATYTIALTTMAQLAPDLSRDASAVTICENAVNDIAPMNMERIYTGEAYMYLYTLLHPINVKTAVELSDNAPNLRSMADAEASRPQWAKVYAEAWAKGLSVIVKDPNDKRRNPLFEQLRSVSRSQGEFGREMLEIIKEYEEIRDHPLRSKAMAEMIQLAFVALSSGKPPEVRGTNDPFRDGPYSLSVDPHGWTLYSYGFNRKDDHAEIKKGKSNDIVIRYQDGVVTTAIAAPSNDSK